MQSGFKKLLLKLPSCVKSPIIRKVVQFPSEIDSSLRLKLAETKEELEQAYSLLYDAYLREGLANPHASGLRVTKYHALPSTSTLIVLEGDSVVGTLSLIRQSSFGMPLETIFDLSSVPPGARVAEVSSLAIRKDLLHQKGRILFPLLKFLYHYAIEYFGVTHFVIAVNPKWYDFYESILLFKKLSSKVVERYDFVNGGAAVGGILDLRWAQKAYAQLYGDRKQANNLHHFFTELECRNMEFPNRKRGIITDPVLTPELMEHFFIQKRPVIQELSDFELMCLRELYDNPAFLRLIPKPNVVQILSRQDKRLETKLKARLFLDDQRSIPFEISNSSTFGLGGLVNAEVKPGVYDFQVDLEEYQDCWLKGEVLWRKDSGVIGVRIQNPPIEWVQFARALNNRLFPNSKQLEERTKKSS